MNSSVTPLCSLVLGIGMVGTRAKHRLDDTCHMLQIRLAKKFYHKRRDETFSASHLGNIVRFLLYRDAFNPG